LPMVREQKLSPAFVGAGFVVAVGLTEGAGVGVAVGMGIGAGEGMFVSPASQISTISGVVCAAGVLMGSVVRLFAVANATIARATTITDRTASAVICKGVKFFISVRSFRG